MKKGFTLVELLAVLVILSIISLISFLIVGNTINTSKTELSEIQIDNIIDAAKVYYLKEGLEEENIDNSITETCVNLKYLIDNDYIDNVEIKNLATKENIVGSVKIKYSNNKYKYEFVEGECSACKLVDGEPNKEGSKYSCEVKEGTSYNFYVLSKNNDGTTNLIMDRNICEDGTLATAEKTCLVSYNSSGDAAGVGPVTAMTYLNNATSTWKNIDNLNLTYDDEGGNFTGFKITGKTRMPYKSEVLPFNNNNGYLYENLDRSSWYYDESIKPTNDIDGILGYWTFYSSTGASYVAYSVVGYGGIASNSVAGNNRGVRPVITLKL